MSLRDIFLLFLLAAILGVLFNFASPQGISIFPETLFHPSSARVDALEAKALLDSGKAVLVDARPKELFTQRHLKGAVSLPPALFDILYMMQLGDVDPEKSIIVYGRTISKLYDEEVARRLRQRDHEDVKLLIADFRTLESHGYQVEQ